MKSRLYLKDKLHLYHIVTINDNSGGDLTITPINSIIFPRTLIPDKYNGFEFSIKYKQLSIEVTHFSVHSKSGIRQFKLKDFLLPSLDRIKGEYLYKLKSPMPLFTMVALNNPNSKIVTDTKTDALVLTMNENTNYKIIDLIAIPKQSNAFKYIDNFKINNEFKTIEEFSTYATNLTNCILIVVVRSSTNTITELPKNIAFQQDIGRSANIKRIGLDEIICEINTVEARAM